MEWLERLSIPEEDYENLHIDDQGGVFYVDPQPNLEEETSSDTDTTESQGLSLSEAFALHSNPGASKVIYLDFDGHQISGTAWNSSVDTLYAAPYDKDGSPYSFSQSELDAIATIWHRVAEDYAAFDVDVTTEAPASMGPETGRILITKSVDENGVSMPYSSAGGVAYVGVWGNSNYEYYQPALVYYNNLGSGHPPYVAEAASHEMGHNQGLSHDGTNSGGTYYGGHGSGFTDWAPIMGNSYGAQVSQWSRGDYDDANNTQDDVAILISNLTERADDHGNEPSAASTLQADSTGTVVATNPESDPFNNYRGNKGVISYSGDQDYFMIDAGSGDISLTINPAWQAYRNDKERGANLDIQAVLLDAQGQAIQTADTQQDTFASIQATVAEGTYYLAITGVGEGSTYDNYASHGQYFINGSVPVPSGDTTDTNTAPQANNDSATTKVDTSVTVDVLSNDTDADGDTLTIIGVSTPSYGTVAISNGSITYTPDGGYIGNDSFSYTIDDGQGGTASAKVAITVEDTTSLPEVPSGLAAQDNANGTASLSWTDTSNESGYEIQRESEHKNRNFWKGTEIIAAPGENTTSFVDSSGSGSGTFRYRIRAFNSAGTSSWSAWVIVTVTDGGNTNDSDIKGNNGKGNNK